MPEAWGFNVRTGNEEALLSAKGVGGIPGKEGGKLILFFSREARDRKCGRGTCPCVEAEFFPDLTAERGGRLLELAVGFVLRLS